MQIGFAMIETLRTLLRNDDETLAWDPTSIAAYWPKEAREIFAKFSESEKADQCHLMIISTHPTENCGESPWARAYVHIFKSPSFEPISVAVNKIGAIGCGEVAEPCRRVVEELSTDYKRMSLIREAEQGTPGGMASMLGIELTCLLKKARPQGISSHLQYCWVYRGKIVVKTNDHSESGPWTAFEYGSGIMGQPSPDLNGATFKMPKLATSWDELDQMIRALGGEVKGCTACG